ncbi:MAG: hypothetical protein HYS24_06980 [Ignavibacteriales bacterium]|jgi:hypothetical protein|nr:hypothetical protein [Ignavibacteriales bacterium]MBK7978769.1 hypothetical protein [Ignavibacteriota bacterium]
MNSETVLENYSKEDYVAENELSINELVKNEKDIYLKIGLGVVYVTLLLLSLFLI